MTLAQQARMALNITLGRRTGQGSRPVGAIVGTAIAVIPIVVVMHISSGMIGGIISRFIETGTYHVRIFPNRTVSDQSLQAMKNEIAALDGVTGVYEEVNGFGLLYTDASRSGVQVRAVDPLMYQHDAGFSRYLGLESGEFSLDERRDILLGKSLAGQLDAGVGDQVRLLTVRSMPNGGMIPRVSSFVVKGVVSTGYQELDRLWVFVGADRGKQVLPPDDSLRTLGVKVSDPLALPNGLFRATASDQQRMSGVLRQIRRLAGSEYQVINWFDMERGRYEAFGSTRTALIIVMIIIMGVAAVNISSSMILLTISQQHAIGVLKALGSTPGEIRRIFLLTGAWVGMIGAGVGILIGALISLAINQIIALLEIIASFIGRLAAGAPVSGSLIGGDFYLDVIPVSLMPGVIFGIWLAALLLAVISSGIPAAHAAKIKPVQVLYRR
ncbi:MAG: ABC transporter permease [Spirochaetaceae bacterium]|nr:MAG: ABC transporter permease [Spirochaetaceae bacterium]